MAQKRAVHNENPIMGPADSCLFCDTCLQYQFTDWKYTILYYISQIIPDFTIIQNTTDK